MILWQSIQQLSAHVADLIAAGEVVERPASVVKELLETPWTPEPKHITVEIQNGGMTFLRVTDDAAAWTPMMQRRPSSRHATSKLHCADDLSSIVTMGFRGEALAAIASVSRIDLLTRLTGAASGTALHLEGGQVTEHTEAGCPDGTTHSRPGPLLQHPGPDEIYEIRRHRKLPRLRRRPAAGPFPSRRFHPLFEGRPGTAQHPRRRRPAQRRLCVYGRQFSAGLVRWTAIGSTIPSGALWASPQPPRATGPASTFSSAGGPSNPSC